MKKVVKIIDTILECIGCAGVISLVGLLLFAPVFKTMAYYTMLLVAVIATATPLFYLAVWAEWTSLKGKKVKENGIQEI